MVLGKTMISHRCKNCLTWDNQHPSVALIPLQLNKKDPGFCRKHRPGSLKIGQHYYGVQPIMDADEFCGEFRADKGA